MIQKIRNYLLLNDDNKSSFFFAAAIALVGPSIFYFFDKNKRSPNVSTVVRNVSLDKRILQIKYQENMHRAKMFFQYFGKTMGEKEILNMLFEGMSAEEFTFMHEIKNCFLAGMLKSDYGISKNVYSKILSIYFDKDKFSFVNKFVGMIELEILKGNQDVENFIKQFGLPLDVIENNAEIGVAAAIGENLLTTNLYLIHSIIKKNNENVLKKNNVSKVIFDVYTIDFNLLKNKDKKFECTENDLKMFYQCRINSGANDYKSPELLEIDLISFPMKDFKKSKEEIKREFSVIYSMQKNYDEVVLRMSKFLDRKFQKINNVLIEGDVFKNVFKILKGDVSSNIAQDIYYASDKRKGNVFILFDNENFYVGFVKNFTESFLLPFEKVKNSVLEDFQIDSKRKDTLYKIQLFQLKNSCDLSLLEEAVKKNYTYSGNVHEEKIKKESSGKRETSLYDTQIESRIKNGMIKKGDCFMLEEPNGILKFFVLNHIESVEKKESGDFDNKNNSRDFISMVVPFLDQEIKFLINKGSFIQNINNDASAIEE